MDISLHQALHFVINRHKHNITHIGRIEGGKVKKLINYVYWEENNQIIVVL